MGGAWRGGGPPPQTPEHDNFGTIKPFNGFFSLEKRVGQTFHPIIRLWIFNTLVVNCERTE